MTTITPNKNRVTLDQIKSVLDNAETQEADYSTKFIYMRDLKLGRKMNDLELIGVPNITVVGDK